MRSGQSGVEFLLVTAVVVSLVLGVLVPFFRESELSTAIAAARAGALQEVTANVSLTLTSVDYKLSGNTATLTPNVYFENKLVSSPAVRLSALKRVADTFSPSKQPASETTCVAALYYTYCVS